MLTSAHSFPNYLMSTNGWQEVLEALESLTDDEKDNAQVLIARCYNGEERTNFLRGDPVRVTARVRQLLESVREGKWRSDPRMTSSNAASFAFWHGTRRPMRLSESPRQLTEWTQSQRESLNGK